MRYSDTALRTFERFRILVKHHSSGIHLISRRWIRVMATLKVANIDIAVNATGPIRLTQIAITGLLVAE